jgi:hypothetical protein
MQLFGRGRRAQRPPADVDLAERLEGFTVRPASPDPAAPDGDEPVARSDAPPGEPTAATGPPGKPSAEGAVPASSASPVEPEGGPAVAATPGAGKPAPGAVGPVGPPAGPRTVSEAAT